MQNKYSEILNELVKSELIDFQNYIFETTQDKYEVDLFINTQKMLLEGSGEFQTYNIAKYLKRYLTDGFSKSKDKKDLYKILHYTLFELARLKYEANNADL